jgi:hypothetical protein
VAQSQLLCRTFWKLRNSVAKTLNITTDEKQGLTLNVVRLIDGVEYINTKLTAAQNIDVAELPSGVYVARISGTGPFIDCRTFQSFIITD